jgi:hypothetical protein
MKRAKYFIANNELPPALLDRPTETLKQQIIAADRQKGKSTSVAQLKLPLFDFSAPTRQTSIVRSPIYH